MRDLLAVTRALSDENRVRILMALNIGELCVCQLTEMLELASSTVSKHISILKQAGFLESRRSGRWIYYFLSDRTNLNTEVIRWMIPVLKNHPVVLRDRKNLDRIKKTDPELLCRQKSRQMTGSSSTLRETR